MPAVPGPVPTFGRLLDTYTRKPCRLFKIKPFCRPEPPKSPFSTRLSSSFSISTKIGSTTIQRPCVSTNCWSSKRPIRAITISGETVRVGRPVAPGRRGAKGIELLPPEVILVKLPLLSFMVDNSSSEPAEATALVPGAVVRAVSAFACLADCWKPVR